MQTLFAVTPNDCSTNKNWCEIWWDCPCFAIWTEWTWVNAPLFPVSLHQVTAPACSSIQKLYNSAEYYTFFFFFKCHMNPETFFKICLTMWRGILFIYLFFVNNNQYTFEEKTKKHLYRWAFLKWTVVEM